ncbi:MAG: 4Fe-4S dicluster domain-containing protein [Candidatus Hodarchaeota archaeon]
MPQKKPAVAFVLKKQNLPGFIQKLTQVLEVYGPVAQKSQFKFDKITDASQLKLDYDTTILPPKKYFFPPKQNTLTFTRSPQLEIHDPLIQSSSDALWNGKSFLVFGVHSCDLAAIQFHDAILTQIYPDPFRNRRRLEGIIIGLNCLNPCEDSFCLSAGTWNFQAVADIMITDTGSHYVFDVKTAVGQRVVEYAQELFSVASPKLKKKVKVLLSERLSKFQNPIEDFDALPDQLDASYEFELWNRLGKRCFGCGSCTMVCPTCFCFDVHDEVDLDLANGARVRTWDSCQLVDFALVAGGHNFRPTIASRIRFRLYHKFRIEPDQINQIGCVGCGRCTRTCPADIDMVELLLDLEKGGTE